MKQVWKFLVPVDDQPHEIDMPAMSVARHVDLLPQSDAPDVVALWVEVFPPTLPLSGTRRFQVYATGQPIPDYATYVGTVVHRTHPLVWHLFEIPFP